MKPWLQLLRAPNLFTVPGDPLAGYLLAAGLAATLQPALFLVIAASLCLYAYGLILNDLMDLPEDRVVRPKRPIASGAIDLHTAWYVAAALLTLGLVFSALPGARTFHLGGELAFAITAYNCGLKKIRFAGALTMGACRGLSLLLGASLHPHFNAPIFITAAITTLYIAGVTMLARNETRNPAIPPLIGRLIRALILIQALYCACSGSGRIGTASALILALALWPLSRIVGRRFYGS